MDPLVPFVTDCKSYARFVIEFPFFLVADVFLRSCGVADIVVMTYITMALESTCGAALLVAIAAIGERWRHRGENQARGFEVVMKKSTDEAR
jgi:hypothetical protein